MRGTGFGIIGDLIVGILGAFIGSWLLPQLGIHLGYGSDQCNRQRYYRGDIATPRRATLSRWRRMGKQVERRLGSTLVTHPALGKQIPGGRNRSAGTGGKRDWGQLGCLMWSAGTHREIRKPPDTGHGRAVETFNCRQCP